MTSAPLQNAAAMGSDLEALLYLSAELVRGGVVHPNEMWAEALNRGWFEVELTRHGELRLELTDVGRQRATALKQGAV